ncbi:MAG: YggS family pyridoxal phosphate-dependent enzyme [Ktedonobacterales bacterium]|nr:YggS family pyridoxal phosphate-dependent enzyme [Ktedonobacterales bacterium]
MTTEPPLLARIAANLADVRARIAEAATLAGRDPATVTLIAVSKTMLPEAIQGAYAAGARHFGENRVQEAVAKVPALDLPAAQWEMIGTLQRNKVRAALDLFVRIHSVESVELAREIDRLAGERGRVVQVLVQVNVAGEASKHGVSLAEALPLARAINELPHLRGAGLMTVAPIVTDLADVRPIFRRLRELRDLLRVEVGPSWQELSMGMTDDFSVAIAEGATLVRVGRAIFGARG